MSVWNDQVPRERGARVGLDPETGSFSNVLLPGHIAGRWFTEDHASALVDIAAAEQDADHAALIDAVGRLYLATTDERDEISVHVEAAKRCARERDVALEQVKRYEALARAASAWRYDVGPAHAITTALDELQQALDITS